MSRILHATSRIITFVDPLLNDPYADIAVRTAGSYRNPTMNAARKLPKKVLAAGTGKKAGKMVKRKVRGHIKAALRRAAS